MSLLFICFCLISSFCSSQRIYAAFFPPSGYGGYIIRTVCDERTGEVGVYLLCCILPYDSFVIFGSPLGTRTALDCWMV